MSKLIRRFAFWNCGAWFVATVIEFAVGGPWSFVVLGCQALFIAGLLIGHYVVERS